MTGMEPFRGCFRDDDAHLINLRDGLEPKRKVWPLFACAFLCGLIFAALPFYEPMARLAGVN